MYNYAVAYMHVQHQYAPSKTENPVPKTDNPTLCRPSGPTNDQVHVLHSLAMTASVNPVKVPLPPMSLVFTSGDPLLMTSNTALTILHPPTNLGRISGTLHLLRPAPKQFITLVLKSLVRSFTDNTSNDQPAISTTRCIGEANRTIQQSQEDQKPKGGSTLPTMLLEDVPTISCQQECACAGYLFFRRLSRC